MILCRLSISLETAVHEFDVQAVKAKANLKYSLWFYQQTRYSILLEIYEIHLGIRYILNLMKKRLSVSLFLCIFAYFRVLYLFLWQHFFISLSEPFSLPLPNSICQ